MIYLINEIVFLLLATAFVSALLGRFLCKSNERAISGEKKQCLAELTQVQKQRDSWEIQSNQWQKKLVETDEKLANKEYEKNSLKTQLDASEKERADLLIEVKKNDVCKAKVASLTEELKTGQAQLHIALKKIENLQNKIVEVTQKNSALEENLDQAKRFGRDMTEKHNVLQENYQQLEQENKALQLDRQALLKLQKIHQKLEMESKDLPALRRKVKALTEERNTLQKANQHLQEQLASISAAHDEQAEIVLRLMSQRDDFLSRLNAVSSVVGAMGINTTEE